METATKLFAGYSIGNKAYEEVGRFCSPYGTRVLLIGGKTGLQKGWPYLEQAIHKTGCRLDIVDTVIYGTECTYARIHELSSRYKDENIDMVFGMGGGKAMDTAKGTACELGVPVFTFPTIPSNCAAMAALSVVYKKDGSFDSFYYYERPAIHCFIQTELLFHGPKKYFRAGLGDTLAKFYECHFSARGDELDFHSALGREISNLCGERIKRYAEQAIEEFDRGEMGDSFIQAVLTIIVNTGLVSHLVEDCYNCAAAHSICYGLDLLPGVSARFLHGDLVGYGILIQLMLDQKEAEAREVRRLLKAIGIPVTLGEMGIKCEQELLKPVLKETVEGPDMEHIPYPVTEEMVWQAIKANESVYNKLG